ncbi:UDP-N-acetylmuramoylalanine--D-glutamate ligase [Porphyromonas macacae]|uniref:UDP-N-acetylmuramoylalanine--D-glutamate ligase n=1 Tax=Porphyromonas macacae TaxID=28115 RepID=A0A0A2EA83_9PORP|nr:UDP-N-acetylmuramoyl-L-alanine--D-glutamate ligase [Porphyromonas macacae]KGN74340.1 UDP-N-acetylmuramoylalanine--D-glutamate ligase [Porphyromonas macacae]
MKQEIYDTVVLGAGESGVGAAILCHAKNLSVFVSDYGTIAPKYAKELEANGIPYEQGKHTEEIILSARQIVKSPGIPLTAPVIRKAQEKGISVISEIELAGFYSDAYMIGITGSNGKTTTTMWLYHILTKAGLDVGLTGNVGFSLARQVAKDPHDYYVIELSSFQLDNMYRFRCNLAVLLNITPDHLDRYDHDFDLYARAKMRIMQNQTASDTFIYWGEDAYISSYVKEHPSVAKKEAFYLTAVANASACIQAGEQIVFHVGERTFSIPAAELALPGPHNQQNAMAAALAALTLDVPDEILREALKDFVNVPHRLEYIATVDGVKYINDSKATNINSTQYALQSMHTPIVLILGGTDKGNDYADIEDLILPKARGLIFLGVDNAKLHSSFDGKVPLVADALSMKEAIEKARGMAQTGDTVLLSPACASFDLFKNYEDRGDQFRSTVLELKTKNEK